MKLEKKQILAMMKKLPKRVDVEDLMYRLYVAEKIQAGEDDIRAGRLVSHDKVFKEMQKWFK